MLIFLQSQLNFCSPENLDFYTNKFPQLDTEIQWWVKNRTFFTGNAASPQTQQVYFGRKSLKILIVGTSQIYLNSFLDNINVLVKDYVQIEQLLISDVISIEDYFKEMDTINAKSYDLVALSFITCNYTMKNIINEETLYDRTNKFYQYKNWQSIPPERIQSMKQIKDIQIGYQKFNNQHITNPIDYFSFKHQQISGKTPLLITSILDTSSSLQQNSITFCHVSPQGQIQSSSKKCLIGIPLGMQLNGIRGSGTIGNGYEFIIKFITQLDSFYNDRIYLFSQFRESTLFQRPNLQQQYNAPYGYTSFPSIQNIMNYYETPTFSRSQDIIMKQNVTNGDILYLESIRIFSIQFTIRGNNDLFDPTYQNNYKSQLSNNQEDMKIFEGINIYICQKINTFYLPKLIGKIQQRDGYHKFIIQSQEFLNQQLNNEVLIWYSYSDNFTKVSNEILNNQKINTSLSTFLQIIGNLIPINLTTISDVNNAQSQTNIYFQSTAKIIYAACFKNNTIDIFQPEFTNYQNELISVKLKTGMECNLYFCNQHFKKFNFLNQNCAKSQEFHIQQVFGCQVLVIFCIFAMVWIIMQQLLQVCVIRKFC